MRNGVSPPSGAVAGTNVPLECRGMESENLPCSGPQQCPEWVDESFDGYQPPSRPAQNIYATTVYLTANTMQLCELMGADAGMTLEEMLIAIIDHAARTYAMKQTAHM